MKYIVEYNTTSEGKDYRKWLPCADYELVLENLLKVMKGGRSKTFFFGPPFILTLCTWLESTINDWLIIDQFEKHGANCYIPITDGYIWARFENKLRIVVAVMTDNKFQLREDSSIVKKLDELIKVRNMLVHPQTKFYTELSQFKQKPRKQRAIDHPIHTLTLKACREYYQAARAFNRKFFEQIDRGYVKGNDLINEIPPKRYFESVSQTGKSS
jgi:hypothetical protein